MKLFIVIVFPGLIHSFQGCENKSDNTQKINAKNNVNELSVSTFDIDVTPPVGSWLAYDRVINLWDLGLRARGVIVQGAGKPIVLCAIDWIAISNGGQDEFKLAVANAAGTVPERVFIHTVH